MAWCAGAGWIWPAWTRFNVTLAERSVGAMLRRLGFRRLSVRPRHPQQDPAAQEAHKKTLPIWSPPQSPSMRANNRSNFGGRTKPGLASNINPRVGRARQPSTRAAGSAPRMGLHIRRHLPSSRYRCGLGLALCQRPSDESASQGDQPPGAAMPFCSSMEPDGIRRAASCASQATSAYFPCRPIRPS